MKDTDNKTITLKNVIIVNDYNYEQGGATKIAIDTANMISKMGYHVVFVSAIGKRGSTALNAKVEQYSLNGKEFLEYNNKIQGMIQGLNNRSYTILLDSVLSRFSNEDTIVHVHGWTKGCSSDFFRLLKKKKYITVVTLHEYFSMCANGAYYDYKKKKACKECPGSIKCMLKNCDSRNYIFKLYRNTREISYRRNMDFNYLYTVFVSDFQKRIIEKYIKVKKGTVITNPYFIEDVDPQTKQWDFVYIGRTTAEKGVDLFLKLAIDLPKNKFLIVGDFGKKVSHNVDVTGWVSEKKVIEYLSKCRVLILPSLWPETFGLNVFKALRQGIPCLVSSNTAAEDYITKENGVVFKQGDYSDMKKKALEILGFDKKIDVSNEDVNKEYCSKLLHLYEMAMHNKSD